MFRFPLDSSLCSATPTVLVLSLEGIAYREVGLFSKQQAISSLEFADLELTAGQLFESEPYTDLI